MKKKSVKSYKQSVLEEPAVISDDLLKEVILVHGPKGVQAQQLFEEEGINYANVEALKLEFKNILKIENLWQFKSLKKLQLSNNVIEKIEGLEELTNLRWLDLSFNRIEVISGLERLTKITDLSLFSNKIKIIQNLDTLRKLQILSIGNNLLEDFSNVIYLRTFKNLHCLCISGNPLTTEESHNLQIIAYLPNLKYLNYRLITDEMRAEASEKYRHEIERMEAIAKSIEDKQIAQANLEEKIAFHRSAFVDNLDGSQLLESIFSEDKEGLLLQIFPPVKHIVMPYRDKFSVICAEWLRVGITELGRRKQEIEEFMYGTEEARMSNRAFGMAEVKRFQLFKTKVFQKLMSLNIGSEENSLQDDVNSITTDFEKQLAILWNNLMGLEMQLTDQLEGIYGKFHNALSGMVSEFTNQIQQFAEQLKELDREYTLEMIEFYSSWCEKTPEEKQTIINAKNEEEEDLEWDPDTMKLLENEMEYIENVLRKGHEVHKNVISDKERTSVERLQLWLRDNLNKFHEKELERNRQRIMEINHFCDSQREELDDICGYPTVFELNF